MPQWPRFISPKWKDAIRCFHFFWITALLSSTMWHSVTKTGMWLCRNSQRGNHPGTPFPEWIRKIARDGMMQLWFTFRACPLEIPYPSMSLSVRVLDGWVFKCPTWWNPGVSDWWSFCGLEESSTSCCQEIGDWWNIPIHTKMSKIVDIVWSFPVDDEEDPQLKLDFAFFLGIPKYSNFSLGLQRTMFFTKGADWCFYCRETDLRFILSFTCLKGLQKQLKGSHCWRCCVMSCHIIRL